MLWYIGKCCKLEPKPVDITNYPSSIQSLSNDIYKEVEELSNDQVKGMQAVVTQWLQMEETSASEPKQLLYRKLGALQMGGRVQFTVNWVKSLVGKYPPEVIRIILGILRHNINKQVYASQEVECCMKLLIQDGNLKREITVPAQITPKTIYDIIMTQCNQLSNCLQPLS